ncbi:MAG: hypothetical protein OEZ01_00810, partial [Candidatus Heimdallarchaeota archaeon]|nr:hypothetical protein [Candidatus Heimdallarchaeota archaeon]
YRMRLLSIRDQFMIYLGKGSKYSTYQKLWGNVHHLSAPASTLPWPDTHAVVTFTMLLSVVKELLELEKKIESLENEDDC